MGIVELLGKIGDEKIELQYLDECAMQLQTTKSKTQITFGTTQTINKCFDTGSTDKAAIIIWVDRDDLKSAQRK